MPRRKITGANDDDSKKPWVSNYPPLQAWLDKHEARCLWQTPREQPPSDADFDWSPSAYVECWMARARLMIVVIFANKMGWEIYTPCNSVEIPVTLEDAEKRLGIVG